MSDSDAHVSSPEESEPETPKTSETAEPVSPVTSPTMSPRGGIHDRSIKGFNVMIARNQYPRSEARRYRLISLEKLLDDAVKTLSLPAKARKIFKSDGTLVTQIEDITERETLYISCGEAFVRAVPSPKRRSPVASPTTSPTKETASPAKETGIPLKDTASKASASKASSSPTKEPEEKPAMTRIDKEKLSFNRVVAVAHRTVDENMKLATASVYDSLTKQQQAKLSTIQAIRDDVQDGLFLQHMMKQGILPATSEIQTDLRDWAVDIFKGIKTDEVKFVVGGPNQSGKTTVLFALAKVLVKKLRLSNESGNYLIFPLSFELQSMTIEDHVRLLRLFITTAFDSLEYSQLRVVPYVETLRKWFTLSVFGTLLTPPSFDEVDFVDMTALHALAKSLNTTLKDNGDHTLEEFIEKVCQFPGNFARCFGLKDVLFIIDSFEFCNIAYTPSEEVFPRSLKGAYLSDYLCLELVKSPYLVSMQNEKLFMDCFTCNDAVLLDVQGLVKDPVSDGYVQFWNPPFRLEIGDCLGCPGYIYRFMRICDLVIQSYDNAAYPTTYSMVRTRAELSRHHLIKQEVLKLARLLSDAGNENYTKDLLNEIAESERMTEKFVVYVDVDEEEEEEAPEVETGRSKAESVPVEPSEAQEDAGSERVDEAPESPRGMTLKISKK